MEVRKEGSEGTMEGVVKERERGRREGGGEKEWGKERERKERGREEGYVTKKWKSTVA